VGETGRADTEEVQEMEVNSMPDGMTVALAASTDVIALVKAEIARPGGPSQAQVAREIGIAASSLSQCLNGKYLGDSAAILAQLEVWLAGREARASVSAVVLTPKYVATPTGQKVTSALTYAQQFADLAVIYGGAGVGKTSACREYAQAGANVWLVTATPAAAAPGDILEEIALALRLGEDVPRQPVRLLRIITNRLRGTRGLLIIDEAQHLTVKALEVIRSLHDATEIGLALVGNQGVYERMYGGGRQQRDFAQLFSRVGRRVPLAASTDADVAQIAAPFGITGEKELRFLVARAKRHGALRGVMKLLRLAATIAAGGGEPIDMRHLAAAQAELQAPEEA
jgi:DNA transposition AAA+ family ATPase